MLHLNISSQLSRIALYGRACKKQRCQGIGRAAECDVPTNAIHVCEWQRSRRRSLGHGAGKIENKRSRLHTHNQVEFLRASFRPPSIRVCDGRMCECLPACLSSRPPETMRHDEPCKAQHVKSHGLSEYVYVHTSGIFRCDLEDTKLMLSCNYARILLYLGCG